MSLRCIAILQLDVNSPCPWWGLQCGGVLRCWYWTPQRNTAPESRPARARRRDTAAARALAHARAPLSADRIRPVRARYWRAKLWTFDWFLTFWRGFECWLPVKGAGTDVSLQLRHWPLAKRHVSTLNGQLCPLNAIVTVQRALMLHKTLIYMTF